MVRVYCRCNSGHYFTGGCCPIDGWSSEDTDAVFVAAEELLRSDLTPSLDELRRSGLSEQAIARTIVVEFGSGDSAFDAVAPEGYVIQGRWHPLMELSPAYH